MLAGCILAVFSFSACDSNEQKMTDEDALLIHTAPATPGVTAAGAGGTLTPVAAPAGSAQNVTAPGTQAAKAAASLNPPHGEPGHKCDIDVGAPLDAQPAQQQVAPGNGGTTITPQAVPQPAAPPAGTNKITSGNNPAHGEPGHRCDIPVGAPLNGTPVNQQ